LQQQQQHRYIQLGLHHPKKKHHVQSYSGHDKTNPVEQHGYHGNDYSDPFKMKMENWSTRWENGSITITAYPESSGFLTLAL
jgi:hypothetical protein